MRTVKIEKITDTDYEVTVTHVVGPETVHEFDDHTELTEFVRDLKDNDYTVLNDIV